MADRAADNAHPAGRPLPGSDATGVPAWRVLDLAFGWGEAFFRTWQAWEDAAAGPSLLHYVALIREMPDLEELRLAQQAQGIKLLHQEQLLSHWPLPQGDFQRLTLAQGRLRLTLCVGPFETSLRELAFEADQVLLDAPMPGDKADPWSLWRGKALARVCRRGTELWGRVLKPQQQAALTPCGFALKHHARSAGEHRHLGDYAPDWEIRHTRSTVAGRVPAAGHCVIIGAGLAGASAAAALSHRGWRVDVLDQGDSPATGASGLPVGLLVPHVSADDCLLSRLSRVGVRMTQEQARRLLREGLDWAPSGVMELPVRRVQSPDKPLNTERWHASAAWIKPAALVQAWLSGAGIQPVSGARVAALRYEQRQWTMLDAQGRALARADRVILANGLGALPLLQKLQSESFPAGASPWQLPRLTGVHGLVSWGFEDQVPEAQFPAWPVNGAGSLAPGIPLGQRKAWFLGAGYHPLEQAVPSTAYCHHNNLERLAGLLPELAQALRPAFERQEVHAWDQVRCATPDRLPLIGPLDAHHAPGLWLYVGLGSRGLTFSALGAELIAAQWAGEPLPIALSQARKLDVARQWAKTFPSKGQRSFR